MSFCLFLFKIISVDFRHFFKSYSSSYSFSYSPLPV
uniref:Uncharacterized protein n=1 Tax=Siphoviridae sp. ct3tr1 TaxID=2827773 RepID=A0A8S5TQ91_9CAUD|nr:MAG TPA: hypothetical protein [Siphoviridae sp. ct3tr1]DAI47675.1 MAG TPA: hypothetical protein [Caudoviricetes sp.]DAK36830.1 MAG TPA: hypothetical protein [Caudoviricetes sp.]DAQ02659.1 MAG TPA: hypothetical protein [Caudoviricetes sp.]DAX45127.1 MAG TPA: hypothetical protein [Caudoviricetes sp.]